LSLREKDTAMIEVQKDGLGHLGLIHDEIDREVIARRP
jgi:hypothetical protein